MERIVRKEDLCTCEEMPHVEHQLCQSCKRMVPVSLHVMGFTNSISWCNKCPEGSPGYALKQMFSGPYTVKIV